MPTYTDPTTGKKITSATPLSLPEMEEAFGAASSMTSQTEQLKQGGGGFQNFLIGAGYGLDKARLGLAQLGSPILEKIGLVSPETTKGFSTEYEEKKQLMEPLLKESTAANIGEFVGEAAPSMVIPGGLAGNFGKRLATSALAGMGQGLIQPVGEKEGGMKRFENVVTGAVGGLAGQGLMSAGAKVYNAIKNPVNTAVQKAADFWKVPVTLGEATDKPGWQRVEKRMEHVPWIGLSGYRRGQNEKASESAKNWFVQYVHDPTNVDNLWAARSENRAYVDDVLYPKVKELVNEIPIENQTIMPTKTREAATELLERYPDVLERFQDTKRKNLFRKIIGETEKKETVWSTVADAPPALPPYIAHPVPAGGGGNWYDVRTAEGPRGLDATLSSRYIPYQGIEAAQQAADRINRQNAQRVTTPATRRISEESMVAQPLTWDEAWQFRKGVGNMVGQAKKKFAAGDIDITELTEMQRLYGSISKDMDNWTNQIGRTDIKEAFKTANDGFKRYVVQYDILDDVMAKAFGQRGPGEYFSPKILSTELKRIAFEQQKRGDFTKKQIDEMWNPDRVSGIANIMQVIKSAGEYKSDPATGARAVPLIGAKLAYAVGAMKSFSIATTARFLLATESGKRLALAASKFEPTSPQMINLLKVLPRAMAQAGIHVTESPAERRQAADGRIMEKSPDGTIRYAD